MTLTQYEVMVDLARQAVHDKDARLIFQDAVRALGLEDKLKVHANSLIWKCPWPFEPKRTAVHGTYEDRAKLSYSAWYAAALFACWQETPWELAMKCQLPVYGFATNDRVPGVYIETDFAQRSARWGAVLYRVEYDLAWPADER